MKAVQLFLELKLKEIETKKERSLKKGLTGNAEKDSKKLTNILSQAINEVWPYALEAGQRMKRKKIDLRKMGRKRRGFVFEVANKKFSDAQKIYKIEKSEPGPRAKELAFFNYQKRLVKIIKTSIHDTAQMALFEAEK